MTNKSKILALKEEYENKTRLSLKNAQYLEDSSNIDTLRIAETIRCQYKIYGRMVKDLEELLK